MGLIFTGLIVVLILQVFRLQILQATTSEEDQRNESEYKDARTRYVDSARGNIYDCKGNLLAYNVTSYSVVMGNSTLMGTNAEKNEMVMRLYRILEENGFEIELDFPIIYNYETGDYEFTISGNALLRFKKNSFGRKSVNDLTDEERDATAREVFDFLRHGQKNVSSMFNIDDSYSIEDTLKIMKVRYALFTQYPQYSRFNICSNIDEKTIAALKENSYLLPGVDIVQKTARVYNDSIYFAHIVGYTGNVNEEEMEVLNEGLEDKVYDTSDIIGKTGIEKEMDSVLRGEKGCEELTVNSLEKVVSSVTKSEPKAGKDIYLTIDRELQIACYHILENNISAILRSKIVNGMSYGGKGSSASRITIPIYEVYNAFIDNGVVDISKFDSEDASETEHRVYALFETRKAEVLAGLTDLLAIDNEKCGNQISSQMQDYLDNIYSMLQEQGVVMRDAVDKDDRTYLQFADNNISLTQYLKYAITHNWVDLSKLGIDTDYFSIDEIYGKLFDHITASLDANESFEKMIYRDLIFAYRLSGKDVCLLLYEQGVLDYDENDYNRLKNGRISAYSFVMQKLESLEINPGMLALEPCSGSIVITDVKTGDVKAMVTYPSYDNNRLANKIDWDYYQSLMKNKATPLINRPTQQMTATGSTFKPLMSLASIGEGIITTNTYIQDRGIFTEVEPSPKCWKYPGNHGSINLTGAIMHSCNYFFYDCGYKMSLTDTGEYSDSLGISKIQKYASLFGFSDKSGVEVPESMPTISSHDAVRTAIGYYHNFAPIQISRYVTAVANKGTVYNLTLVDKIVDKNENLIVDNSATVYNKIEIYSDNEWNAVQKGMYNVVNTGVSGLNSIYGNLGFKVAGKTGTAQVSLTHPSHGLFISFAPFEDPEVSVTVVLPNGYASANAAKLAREVYGLYFNDENKEELLSGDLTTTSVTSIHVSD